MAKKKTAKKAAKRATKKKNSARGSAGVKVDPAEARERVLKIMPLLKKSYPDARTSLDHSNPLELLIATILAAQCTDKRVNIVTRDLFGKYHSAADWAGVEAVELEEDIRSTGFYKNKAKNIQAACKLMIDKYGGAVPQDMAGLLELPGVGRKTANVILGNCFDTQGIVCDTHVIRLSGRLGLSENRDPVKLEYDLMDVVPKKRYGGWTMFSHLLVFHGRAVCKARGPKCGECPIAGYCPSAGKV